MLAKCEVFCKRTLSLLIVAQLEGLAWLGEQRRNEQTIGTDTEEDTHWVMESTSVKRTKGWAKEYNYRLLRIVENPGKYNLYPQRP